MAMRYPLRANCQDEGAKLSHATINFSLACAHMNVINCFRSLVSCNLVLYLLPIL
ncbi:hypothetical protein M378DRAFT_166818 [Amanita muscaria Koide BX008]|uniref:Uncharacterized protein n=1 Tax=Amanita muscaria (strain Koide BX008) TaxID=946122 RepID=A0A0C2WXJ3_AMAMK|nr:hypothetical protein M378DRAFT_166818 [Amanita muscaria Koide BX008]